jgi:transcriptional regulator with XRE-family HTH domain
MPADVRPPLLLAFGAAIRRLRRDRGLSQEAFADLVGMNRTYVGDAERGERNVCLVNLGRIAGALGITLSSLLEEVEREQG